MDAKIYLKEYAQSADAFLAELVLNWPATLSGRAEPETKILLTTRLK